MAETVPEQADLRSRLAPVRDQGERGTCLAFAVTAAHEAARTDQENIPEDLAEEVLYWGCKQIDGNQSRGTSFSSATAALKRWGQPAEDAWPYVSDRDDSDPVTYIPPHAALHNTECYRAELSKVELSIQELKRNLNQGHTVAFGMQLTFGFYQAPNGQIEKPIEGEPLFGEHAILIAGYEDSPGSEDGILIVRNSWGASWGDRGYGYMPYAYFESYAFEAWIVDPESITASGDCGQGQLTGTLDSNYDRL